MKPGRSSAIFGWLLNRGQFDFRFSGRVLEVGAGRQRLDPHSITVDSDPSTHPDFVADIRKLPFQDGEFDLVIAHEVFCVHSREVQLEMLRELRRVGKSLYLRQWKWCAWKGCKFKFEQTEILI